MDPFTVIRYDSEWIRDVITHIFLLALRAAECMHLWFPHRSSARHPRAPHSGTTWDYLGPRTVISHYLGIHLNAHLSLSLSLSLRLARSLSLSPSLSLSASLSPSLSLARRECLAQGSHVPLPGRLSRVKTPTHTTLELHICTSKAFSFIEKTNGSLPVDDVASNTQDDANTTNCIDTCCNQLRKQKRIPEKQKREEKRRAERTKQDDNKTNSYNTKIRDLT